MIMCYHIPSIDLEHHWIFKYNIKRANDVVMLFISEYGLMSN